MGITGADSNTGLSPVDWGSWETTWTGKKKYTDVLVIQGKQYKVLVNPPREVSLLRGEVFQLLQQHNFLDTTILSERNNYNNYKPNKRRYSIPCW